MSDPARIPRPALILGLAGTLPFIFGAVFCFAPVRFGTALGLSPFVAAFLGPNILAAYGKIILSFMSGALWGFATLAKGRRAAIAYGASTVPALYVLFATSFTTQPLLPLSIGFAGLLAFDYGFHRAGLAPPWWMPLRLLLTAIVLTCFVLAQILT